jgi:hypothetical protein
MISVDIYGNIIYKHSKIYPACLVLLFLISIAILCLWGAWMGVNLAEKLSAMLTIRTILESDYADWNFR